MYGSQKSSQCPLVTCQNVAWDVHTSAFPRYGTPECPFMLSHGVQGPGFPTAVLARGSHVRCRSPHSHGGAKAAGLVKVPDTAAARPVRPRTLGPAGPPAMLVPKLGSIPHELCRNQNFRYHTPSAPLLVRLAARHAGRWFQRASALAQASKRSTASVRARPPEFASFGPGCQPCRPG